MQNQANYVPYIFTKDFPFIEWNSYLYTPPIQRTQLHAHNCIEVGFCFEGSGVFYLNNRLVPYQKGDITIIMPNQPHIAKSHEHDLAKWHFIMMDASYYNKMSLLTNKNSLLLSNSTDLIYLYSNQFVYAFVHKTHHHHSDVLALGQLMLNQISDLESDETPINPKDHLALSMVIEYISDHYQSAISVDELAKVCHTSVSSLRRKFYTVFNQSPQQFLIQTRLNLAARYLENASMTITEVAYASGFGSLSSFNRHFKTHFNMSPREYRDQTR